jgi:hypothetical protein
MAALQIRVADVHPSGVRVAIPLGVSVGELIVGVSLIVRWAGELGLDTDIM